MKFNKLAIAVGAAVLGLSSIAQAEISANIGVTSNYIWRGVTQSGDEAAVSGGVDYAHDSGFYLGTWASSLGGGGEELDIYAGFSGEAGDIGYDIGVNRYMYPSANDIDFTELYASVSFGPVTGGLAYTFEAEKANAGGAFDEGDLYAYLSGGMDLPEGFSMGATLGAYMFENDGPGFDADYQHLTLDFTKGAGDFGDFTFSVSKNFGGQAVAADDGITPFVSWSKSF